MTEYTQPDTSHLSTVFLIVRLLHQPPILFHCFQLLPQNSSLKTVAIVILWKCGSILASLCVAASLNFSSPSERQIPYNQQSVYTAQPPVTYLKIRLSSALQSLCFSSWLLAVMLQFFTSLLSVTTVRRFSSSKLSRACSLNFLRSLCVSVIFQCELSITDQLYLLPSPFSFHGRCVLSCPCSFTFGLCHVNC